MNTTPQAALVEALPPLPEPVVMPEWQTSVDGKWSWKIKGYTADQMRAYGEACARAALAQAEAAQPVAGPIIAARYRNSPTGRWTYTDREIGSIEADGWREVTYLCDANAAPQPAEAVPIDMVLHCPACGMQHIDAAEVFTPAAEGCQCRGEDRCESCHQNEEAWRDWKASDPWTNPPHRSHLCHGCGHIWRPADVPTNGVAAVKTKGKADSPPAEAAPTAITEQEREHFAHWIATAMPFDTNVGMVEHSIKTSAAWQGWMARATNKALQDALRKDERQRCIDLCIGERLTYEVGTNTETAYGEGVESCIGALGGPALIPHRSQGTEAAPTGPLDDFGRPIVYDTEAVDNVTHALTGDEGEDDSVTVLEGLARYVENVWPGKTAQQVLIEYEEKLIAEVAPKQEAVAPELTSGPINDACWAFVEAMPHRLPGPIWNDLKPAVHAAVCKWLEAQREDPQSSITWPLPGTPGPNFSGFAQVVGMPSTERKLEWPDENTEGRV